MPLEASIQTRLAVAEDARPIWEIRNQPAIRICSFNSSSIGFERHKVWFERQYFGGMKNVCYVMEKNKEVIGYVRFDTLEEDSDAYETSIAVDGRHQGGGLGSRLLKEAVELFRGAKKGKAIARIKRDNTPSLKLFEKCGFKLASEDNESVVMEHFFS